MTTTSQIFIEATETDPSVRAQAAIGQVQQELLRRVRAQAALLTELKLGHNERVLAWEHLLAFCTEQVRGYLNASGLTLHAAAVGAAEYRLLVRGLSVTAGLLDRHIEALAEAEEPATVSAAAEAIEAVLAAHLAVEHDVLLPALAALPGADLPVLVGDFETVRAGGRLETPEELDVRTIPHGQRHPRIFARFARLSAGEGFQLVNNHDPKPLRREFEATYPGAFTWDYLESGPELWRVRIGREAGSAV